MNSNDDKDPRIEEAFKQLDGALCIWARAMGETPLRQYIFEVTHNRRRVLIGDTVYQFVVTVADENDK